MLSSRASRSRRSTWVWISIHGFLSSRLPRRQSQECDLIFPALCVARSKEGPGWIFHSATTAGVGVQVGVHSDVCAGIQAHTHARSISGKAPFHRESLNFIRRSASEMRIVRTIDFISSSVLVTVGYRNSRQRSHGRAQGHGLLIQE